MSTTIRKVLIPSFGDASHVTIVNAEIQPPAANQVQVKVLYAGMSGADQAMRMGYYPMQKKAPLTPGYCLVGRVHRNGSSSTKFQKGDLVVCLSIYDAQAELVNLPEKYLISVPKGVDLQQATAMILDWNTAYGMVYRSAKVSKGQRVFIHGLSGAVGYALLTLCKLEGAEVYGTASLSKHAELREVGATPFVYTDKNWVMGMNTIGGAHVVFDPLGYESWDESWRILAREGGHLIGYGGNLHMLNGGEARSQIPSITKLLARNMVPFCPQKTSFYYISRDQSTFEPELKALFDMVLQGKIKAPIRKEWTMDEVPEAHRTWTQSGGIGSVVVKIADDVEA
ncbi:zinc-binding dehydrogenase [Trematosphaeria pertusa]|uniref:Zinc-binding dehydrogenase n=1 Tax=Trematosphaeria pertusa TaxID=390896 RepID=A0A6A6IG67_9PLEO|nr:zinc-binding dehydrogenase [Trematosphaeria pertusa]KAF2249575.1 zinc-binding dehydrogenase [Trematosphaeria pertusa]